MIPDRAPSQEFEPADGVMTEFSLNIAAPEPENIHVAINGVELTSGFIVSSATTGSSFVKFDTPPEAGAVVSAWRLTPMAQERAFGTGSAFYPKQVEKALDRVTAIVQEIRGGTTATSAVPVADYAHSATVAARADYTAYATAAGTASEAGLADMANSASFAYSAGGLTAGAMEEVVSAVAGAVTVTSVTEAGVASSLTSAAMTAVVNSAAAAVTVTSVAEAGVASGLTNGAKADIVSSAAAAVVVPDAEYDGPFRVQINSGGTVTVDGPQNGASDRSVAGYVYGCGGESAAFGSTSFPFAGNANHKMYVWAYGRGSGVAGSPVASIGYTSNQSLYPDYFYSGGTYTKTPNDFCVLLAEVYSANAANGGTSVKQLQYGHIYAPNWGVQATSGVSMTSDGVLVLTEATSSAIGGVLKVTSIGMNTDSSAVPTVGAVKDYVAASGGTGGSGTIIYSGGTADFASSAGALTAAAASAIVSSAAAAVTSVSEAGVASSLTAAAKADILASAGGSGGSGGTIIYSGGTADFASSAGGLTSAAKADIISSAGGTVSQGTLLTVTDAGDISASPLSNFSPTVTSAVNDYSALGTVVRVDTIDLRWGGPSGLNALAVPTANAVHAHVSSYVSSNTKYKGPFAVTTSGTSLKVAGGRMYLGGAEYAVGSTTLTSSNGTVYYYVYYSSGSYYSGCSVAASASALAAVIRGSQGYYTALANVQGGSVTQCHYGDIRIDGRVS